jgi:hypothetical protein
MNSMPPLKGGQGRSFNEITTSAAIAFLCVVGGVVVALLSLF